MKNIKKNISYRILPQKYLCGRLIGWTLGTRHVCVPLCNSSYKPATIQRLKKYVVVDLNSLALFCVC